MQRFDGRIERCGAIDDGGIHHLPVTDADEHVIGLITYHRILEAWLSHGHPDTESLAEVAGDVPVDMLMEKDVLTVDAETTAAEAARLLETNKFGKVAQPIPATPVRNLRTCIGSIAASTVMSGLSEA